MVMPTSVPMLQAPASAALRTTLLPSTESGRNGSSCRVRRQAKMAHSSTEAPSSETTRSEVHAYSRPPQDSASSNRIAAHTMISAPIASSRTLRA